MERARLGAFAVLAIAVSGGCARAPAGTGTGPRLVVTMRFREPVKPIFYYFVLIRNAPDSESVSPRNFPVPVIANGGGNGFATGATSDNTAPFTDFVQFGGSAQPTASGYGVYHVPGYLHGNVNVPNGFKFAGAPDFAASPTAVDPNTLQFELSLSKLRAEPGECDTTTPGDCPIAKYLNINIVATTTLAFDPQHPPTDKATDAIGDQSSQLSPTFNLAVNIDTTRDAGRVFQSSQSQGDPYYEPDNDTINPVSPSLVDPAIELVAWQIQIRQ